MNSISKKNISLRAELDIPAAIEKNSRIQKGYWEQKSKQWGAIQEPFRPSEDDVLQYVSFLKQCALHENARILILGATPELRDCVAVEYPGAEIYVCDISKEVMQRMTAFRKRGLLKYEHWIQADWMDDDALPFYFFDAVLGDLVLLQFPPFLQHPFLQRVSSRLSQNGHFITRCRWRTDLAAQISNQQLINLFLNLWDGREQFIREAFLALMDVNVGADGEVLQDAILDFLDAVPKQEADNFLTKLAGIVRGAFTQFSEKWKWASPRKNSLLPVLGKFFKVDNLYIGYSKLKIAEYPILLLKKLHDDRNINQ